VRHVKRPGPYTLALLLILAIALGLRLWTIGHGLPFIYDRDEEYHFVPVAIRMFGGNYDPGYFQNPSAFTYLLHGVFRVRFATGFPFGATHLRQDYAADPGPAVLTARLVVALIATLSVWLIAVAGRRLFDRRVGLIAASLSAVAFLPVFYAHLALNDAVALAPATAVLIGCAAIRESASRRAYLLTGAALGAAVATKYTAVAYAVPLVVTALIARPRAQRTDAWHGLALASGASALVFVALNPFVVLDHAQFTRELHDQMTVPRVPGETHAPAIVYYAKTLTWGLGWLPLLAAAVGAALLVARDRTKALIVLPVPLVLLAMLSTGNQLFARWLLPAYPALVLVAAYGAVAAVDRLPRTGRRCAPSAALAGAAVLLGVQGSAESVHLARVFTRTDTRTQAHRWLMGHTTATSRVVVEPFLPRGFYGSTTAPRFVRFPVPKRTLAYEQSLRPELLDAYRRGGWCLVVVGSYQRDRGLKEGYPGARAYYRRLEHEAWRAANFRPYRDGATPVEFDYDVSFNFVARSYSRPGPEIRIYKLRGCRPKHGIRSPRNT
jgi:hypothetical protein